MGPAVFILAIMGCGEGNTQCQNVAVMPTHYESAAACDQQSEDALRQYVDIEYPVVVAQCLRMDAAAMAIVQSSDVKLPLPERPAPVKRATYKVERARG
jgi:hypothetical protein